MNKLQTLKLTRACTLIFVWFSIYHNEIEHLIISLVRYYYDQAQPPTTAHVQNSFQNIKLLNSFLLLLLFFNTTTTKLSTLSLLK